MKGTIASVLVLASVPYIAGAQSLATTESSFLETAMKWPTHFGVTNGEFDAVWTRARTWAQSFGNGTFTVLDDFEITTIRPPTDRSGAATLRITNSETFGGFRILVEVIPHRADEKDAAQRVAHLLAYHLASGKPVPEDLVSL
jgi:hypothetical protein